MTSMKKHQKKHQKNISMFMFMMGFVRTSARLNSHHGAAVTSRVAGATKNSSHITTLKSHHGHHFLKGGKLRINHSHLHWGAGLGRLVAYASIIAIYVSALTDYVPRAPNKATETRLILLNLQGSSSPAVIVFLHFVNVFVGYLIVCLHLSNVCIDFRKGREDFFKIKD